jgi:glucose-1-phosphate thymidylyltransferase
MKGIILAGGAGSRLYPITSGVSKQLLPIYDKPMIYYPLSTLMEAGIKDILIITKSKDQESFKEVLGDGRNWGIRISYAIQDEPKGIAEAFVIGEDFIGNDQVCLILGDNLFWAEDIGGKIQSGANSGYCIFSYVVSNPSSFGVIERGSRGEIRSIEEKPTDPKSNEVSIGIYIYHSDVIQVAKALKPSKRLEFEISDINNHYLNLDLLDCHKFPVGTAWLDTGTVDSLNEASEFVKVIQNRQGVLVGSPDEVSFRKGWISKERLFKNSSCKSKYCESLRSLIHLS